MERKVKYNYEFKLHCVEEVLNKNRSKGSVAQEQEISKTNLGRWINFYLKYGKEGLLSRKNQNYSSDFKLKVIRTIDQKCLSLSQACLFFNIPNDGIILAWQRQFKNHGAPGLVQKPKGKPISMTYKRAKKKSDKPLTREEELLLENESLRAQVAYLKKLQALIQAEEAEQNKRHKP
ncbi:transposase [Flavobacterium sp. WV_118_3]